MKQRYLVISILFLAAVMSALLVVQGSDLADSEHSRVRVAHAVMNVPFEVDVTIDGQKVFEGLGYKTVTPYATLPAGPHQVWVGISGLPPVVSQTMILTGGMDVTIAGVGQGASNVTVTVLLDNNGLFNNNTVRLVNLSPNTPAVDVVVAGPAMSTTVSNLPYKGASDYVNKLNLGLGSLGGLLDFEVRPAGQMTSLLTVGYTFEANTIDSIFIMGLSGASGTNALQAVHSVDRKVFGIFLPLILKH